jgi:hypothetical protein
MAYRSYAIDYLGEEEGYGLIERVEDREYQTLVTDHSVSAILKHVARHLEDTDDIYIPELVAEVLDIESSHKYNQIMSAMEEEMKASEHTQGILNALFNSLFKDISESTNRPGGEVMGADELKETQMPKRPEPLHDLEADVDQEVQREYYKRFQEWKQEQQRLEEERNDDD